MFQGSPLPLRRPREKHVRTRWKFESTILEDVFDRTRGKRSIQDTSGETKRQSNTRMVRIFHRYQYFLQVSKDGKVNGTKDTNNGNSKSDNLNLFFIMYNNRIKCLRVNGQISCQDIVISMPSKLA